MPFAWTTWRRDRRSRQLQLQVLLVLSGAVVAVCQGEDQRIAALKPAERTHRAGVVRESVIRKDAAGSDVRSHRTHGRARGRPVAPVKRAWPYPGRSCTAEVREMIPEEPGQLGRGTVAVSLYRVASVIGGQLATASGFPGGPLWLQNCDTLTAWQLRIRTPWVYGTYGITPVRCWRGSGTERRSM